ncbi:hypothetical protein [Longispora fulva]|uniref:Uncharacterized protein n=1 Tax=Longispora fulva TaxID=619741 RepID=A0A8J7GUM8_9ACTN|nr:hypothetical protein [Longispora fulva]MBG6137701.1 hypothetical protein [Longispora fulva]
MPARPVLRHTDPGLAPGPSELGRCANGAHFLDPSGHNMEIITRPYGSAG